MSSNETLSSGQLRPAVAGEVDANEGPNEAGGCCGCGAVAAAVVAVLLAALTGVVGAPLVSSVSVNWPSARPNIPTDNIRTMHPTDHHRCKAG